MPINGLCECGCGQVTKIAEWNNRNSPIKAGQHYRFISGHNHMPRTPNEFRENGDHALMVLRTAGGEALSAVDYSDIESLKNRTWCIKNGYAHYKSKLDGKRVSFYLHHFLLNRIGINDGQVIDHINRNTLDNRRSNLRVVSRALNCHNSVHKSASGLRGAYLRKQDGKYVAKLNHNSQQVMLGLYRTADEANHAVMSYLRAHDLIP